MQFEARESRRNSESNEQEIDYSMLELDADFKQVFLDINQLLEKTVLTCLHLKSLNYFLEIMGQHFSRDLIPLEWSAVVLSTKDAAKVQKKTLEVAKKRAGPQEETLAKSKVSRKSKDVVAGESNWHPRRYKAKRLKVAAQQTDRSGGCSNQIRRQYMSSAFIECSSPQIFQNRSTKFVFRGTKVETIHTYCMPLLFSLIFVDLLFSSVRMSLIKNDNMIRWAFLVA